MNKCEQILEPICSKLHDVPAFLTRITVGWVMLESGWGKFGNLEGVTTFFGELGIPAPHLQAPFVAGVETLGGLCLILGLCTRIASIPLSITMIVAILTAKMEEVKSLSDLFGLSEFLYIVLMVWLIVFGPGKWALDKVCCKKN